MSATGSRCISSRARVHQTDGLSYSSLMSSTPGTPEDAPTQESVQREIDAAYGQLDTDLPNLAYVVYSLITSAPAQTRGALFQYAVEHDARASMFDQGKTNFSTKSLKLDPILTENDVAGLKERLGQLIDTFLDVIIREQHDTHTFYQQLALMLDNPILRSDKDRGFAFYWCYIDKRLPYFQLDEGLSLSNDDWRDLGIALRPEKAKIRYILATEWISRSSQADHILRVLDERSDVERVRLMAFLIWELESRTRGAAGEGRG